MMSLLIRYADARDQIIMRSIRLPNGCWEWVGRKHNMGYGTLSFAGNPYHLAHRVAYIVFIGPIPKGNELHHTCHNRRCVNPGHLLPVTHAEHMRIDGNSQKTRCPKNHPLDGVKRDGTRYCKTCNNLRSKEFARKNPEVRKRQLADWHRRNPGKAAEYARRSNSKPEIRERRNAYLREYNKRPDVRAKKKTQHQNWAARNRERINANWRKNYQLRKERDAAR